MLMVMVYGLMQNSLNLNNDGMWSPDEDFIDIGNGYWDKGEDFTDSCECEKMGKVCHEGECVEYLECQDINQNGKRDKGLDVVLVELDDETFRLINEPMPYSRGTLWARTVRNLADAEAKVIVLDFMYDKPDHQTLNLRNYLKNNNIDNFEVNDGDKYLLKQLNMQDKRNTCYTFFC